MDLYDLKVIRLRYPAPEDELVVLRDLRALLCEAKAEPPGMILHSRGAEKALNATLRYPGRVLILSERPATLGDAHQALGLNALKWNTDPERALALPTVEDLARYLAGEPVEASPDDD